MSREGSVLALRKCLACLEFMLFPVWRGIGAGGGGAGWSQGWGRCLRWEPYSRYRGPRMPAFDYPVWLVLCRRGRARFREVCQRGRGAIRLPTDMLSIKLPQLFDIHQIPKVFREDSIISGYRHPSSSALDCVLSSFQLTNETINIWTHFLPTWYFLWRFSVLCATMNFLSDSYTWPLLVYMLLICIYPFTSSCAHTFSTMSPESRHICYFFDYGALSLYSLGCAIGYGYYVMPDCWVNTWLHQHFVPIAIGNTLFCTSMSCYSRFLELQFPQRSKALRTAAFIVPFIFDTVPLFYRILLCCGWSCGPSGALSSHCYHLLFAFLTCFLFTAHLPERLAPGRFDYFGCAIGYGYYVMPDCWVNTWLHQHFVPIAIGNTLFCTSMSCYSRFLELQFPQRSKALRTAAFIVPFIFDTVPLFYRILLCCGWSCGPSGALSSHCYHLLFAFLTCFLFTAHLPERLAPGRFDYFGHSHQLFHISAVVGTHFQMEGVIADMAARRAWLQAHGVMPSVLGTGGALAVSLVLNLGIIGIFSAPLLRKPCHASALERKEQ
ncbi:membrane progestin receptor delta isoform X2 [Cololabis saira]|uniref:membrane progestin receptor delta isoform X2 n=1 Tax=Cololabis saira TaxID=129043 RepID=UPI002AD4B30F|nr:membrane progestin receptor delta isoform X2 [Cololabis saira]